MAIAAGLGNHVHSGALQTAIRDHTGCLSTTSRKGPHGLDLIQRHAVPVLSQVSRAKLPQDVVYCPSLIFVVASDLRAGTRVVFTHDVSFTALSRLRIALHERIDLGNRRFFTDCGHVQIDHRGCQVFMPKVLLNQP